MTDDPSAVAREPLPVVGERVRIFTKTAARGVFEPVTKEGTVSVVWAYDGEPVIDLAEGGSCHVALGDRWERL
jgi:hypothetical protein